MKKIILALLLLSTFLLFGCTGKDNGKNNEPKEENQVVENQTNTNAKEETPQSPAGSPLGFDTLALTGEDIHKNPVDNSIFKDKVTLVNVWGTFCGPCINELQDLNALHQEFKDQNFQILGIIVDTLQGSDENMDLAKQIITQKMITYPMVVPSQETVDNYLTAIQGVPTSFFVDGEGKIISDPIVGALPKAEYQKLIEKQLEK